MWKQVREAGEKLGEPLVKVSELEIEMVARRKQLRWVLAIL
jgi:hypothetical protein